MNEEHRETIHFVTGRLAAPIVREIVESIASIERFDYSISVLPITVAALITPKWLKRHLVIPDAVTRIVLPGYLAPHLRELQEWIPKPLECGPKDIRDLPTMFGKKRFKGEDYGEYSIEVIAEINHAPSLPLPTLLSEAEQLIADGADRIDLGCNPGSRWTQVASAVAELVSRKIPVSIDTFDSWEAATATGAGADLVLSVNKKNREACLDWGAEVVVVPEDLHEFEGELADTVEFLDKHNVAFRLDPILEPIGCGFSESLNRYLRVRNLFPESKIMMGIGNLTELTDCDSAGLNTLLLGFCEEQQIGSVLTTQVIPWAQSSVKECNLARKLVNYSVRHKTPPKHLEEGLVMLRDPSSSNYSEESLKALAASIRDNNYRIFMDGKQIHLISADIHIQGTEPFAMMEELLALPASKNVDPSHAFYLGFELAKALTALTLGKRYEQDVSLRWGMHTRDEPHHRLQRKLQSRSE